MREALDINRFRNNQRSVVHQSSRKLKNLLKLYFEIKSVKFDFESDSPETGTVKSNEYKYILKPSFTLTSLPRQLKTGSRLIILARFTWFLILRCMAIKYIVLLLVGLSFDTYLCSSWHSLSLSSSFNMKEEKSCSRSSNIEQIVGIRQLLKLLNDPFPELPGCPVIFYSMLVCVLIVDCLKLTSVADRTQLRVDCLSFAINPRLERKRIDNALKEIVVKVKKDYLIWEYNIGRQRMFARDTRYIPNQFEYFSFQYRMFNPKIDSNPAKRAEFFLRDILQEILILPANLQAQWCQRLLFYIKFGLPIITVSFIGLCLFGLLLLLSGESLLKAQPCLSFNKCRAWNRNNQSDLFHLSFRKLGHRFGNQNYENPSGMYLTADNSIWITQLFSSKYLFIELVISTIYIATSLGFNTWLYFITIWDKLLWLKQIETQLEECLKLYSSNRDYILYQLSDSHDNELKKLELSRALLVTYLNFRLFSGQFSSFKVIVTLSLQISVSVMALLFLASYWSLRNSGCIMGKQLILYTALMMPIFNLYPLCSALLISKLCNIMKSLNKLLAYPFLCPHIQSTELGFIMHLWRRQPMTYPSLKAIYACNILGISISNETLISLNLHMVALWLALF